MMGLALYAALGCAVVGAISGNRTAYILVPLVGACLMADAYDAVFRPEYWLGMDAAAMVLIIGLKPRIDTPDWIVLLLFPLAWPLYLAPDPYRYIGSVSITICQLCLTFPSGKAKQALPRLVARWKVTFRHRDEWTDLRARRVDV